MTSSQQHAAVGGWDFKQYVLGTLFYRFIYDPASGLFKKETNNNILADVHIEQIMAVFEGEDYQGDIA